MTFSLPSPCAATRAIGLLESSGVSEDLQKPSCLPPHGDRHGGRQEWPGIVLSPALLVWGKRRRDLKRCSPPGHSHLVAGSFLSGTVLESLEKSGSRGSSQTQPSEPQDGPRSNGDRSHLASIVSKCDYTSGQQLPPPPPSPPCLKKERKASETPGAKTTFTLGFCPCGEDRCHSPARVSLRGGFASAEAPSVLRQREAAGWGDTPLSFRPGRAGRRAVCLPRVPDLNLVGLAGICGGWGRGGGWGAPFRTAE